MKKLIKFLIQFYYTLKIKIRFIRLKLPFPDKMEVRGVPIFQIHKNGKLVIGKNFRLNSGYAANVIGRQQKSVISVSAGAKLVIGENVGISSTVIICSKHISIANNVLIGGNTCIYDTDFHSIYSIERIKERNLKQVGQKRSVIISENVFIGAHSTILKGVTIGKNSVIGACSVVSKNIPNNEIWAGNPARFIRKIDE